VNKFTIVASRIPDAIVAFGQTRHNILDLTLPYCYLMFIVLIQTDLLVVSVRGFFVALSLHDDDDDVVVVCWKPS
jgi:hypothetical protein